MQQEQSKKETYESECKVGPIGYVALVFAILCFSGLLTNYNETLQWIGAFDFSTLTGQFGSTAKPNANFMGVGGVGAKQGFLFSLTLVPGIMFALGLIEIFDKLGALKAAQRLLTPLLRPLMGVPGVAGFILVTGIQSTDAASTITRQVKESGLINEKERVIIVTWLFAACGLMVNYFGSGAALFDKITVPIIVPLVVIILAKFIGANIVRVLLKVKGE